MNRTSILSTVLGTAMASVLAVTPAMGQGFGSHDEGPVQTAQTIFGAPTLVEAIEKRDNLSTLTTIARASREGASPLADGETYVVFAPTNEAFEGLSSDAAQRLDSDANFREAVLASHVLTQNEIDEDNLTRAGNSFKTVNGQAVQVTGNSGRIDRVNGHDVVGKTYTAFGTIYMIDGVILPED